MTKIMNRVFSAVENKEDTILNQLENDIELAQEDGLMDSQQYSIKKLSDNKFELTDKVNNEVTNIESDDNKLALSEPVSETEIQDIPLNSQVAWIDESDNIHQGTLKELNGNLVTIKPMSEDEPEVTLNKDQVRLLDSKTYAAKFKDHKMVIRLGEYDIEFDINTDIARVLDEKIDCSWKFNKNDKMSMIIKQAQKEIEGCNKPESKKFSVKEFSSKPIKIFYSYVAYNPNNNPTHVVHFDFKPVGGLDKEHAQLECDKLKSRLEGYGYTHIICKIVTQSDRYRDFIEKVKSKYPDGSKLMIHSKTFSIRSTDNSLTKKNK